MAFKKIGRIHPDAVQKLALKVLADLEGRACVYFRGYTLYLDDTMPITDENDNPIYAILRYPDGN